MDDAYKAVMEEMERFRAALPELLKTLPGKWVVFKDGEVRSVHDDEDAAFLAGMQAFGRDGGHVVACIEPERVWPVSGYAAMSMPAA